MTLTGIFFLTGSVRVSDIINPQIRLSQLFGTLEEHAERLGIVDYSVSQMSLQEVTMLQEINL